MRGKDVCGNMGRGVGRGRREHVGQSVRGGVCMCVYGGGGGGARSVCNHV